MVPPPPVGQAEYERPLLLKGWRLGVFLLFVNHLDLTYHTTSMFLFVVNHLKN